MTLKTYPMSPKQLAALQQLAEADPEKFSLPVSNGFARYFYFPIEETHHVSAALTLAEKRRINWAICDVSDHLIEFDAAWNFEDECLLIKRMDLQFEDGVYIATNQRISREQFEKILLWSVYGITNTEHFMKNPTDWWDEWRSDLMPAIVCHWLVDNLVEILEEQAQEKQPQKTKKASLKRQALAA